MPAETPTRFVGFASGVILQLIDAAWAWRHKWVRCGRETRCRQRLKEPCSRLACTKSMAAGTVGQFVKPLTPSPLPIRWGEGENPGDALPRVAPRSFPAGLRLLGVERRIANGAFVEFLRKSVADPGLPSYHPYGISVWLAALAGFSCWGVAVEGCPPSRRFQTVRCSERQGRSARSGIENCELKIEN